jgi:hypothetical protein
MGGRQLRRQFRKMFHFIGLRVSHELGASLSHLTPAKMRERAIDYLLMAGATNAEHTRATFLRVAARLQECARDASSLTLSPPAPTEIPDAAEYAR